MNPSTILQQFVEARPRYRGLKHLVPIGLVEFSTAAFDVGDDSPVWLT
jgi:hypothetical protein